MAVQSFPSRPAITSAIYSVEVGTWAGNALNERSLALGDTNSVLPLVGSQQSCIVAYKSKLTEMITSWVNTNSAINGDYNAWFSISNRSKFPFLSQTAVVAQCGFPTNWFTVTPMVRMTTNMSEWIGLSAAISKLVWTAKPGSFYSKIHTVSGGEAGANVACGWGEYKPFNEYGSCAESDWLYIPGSACNGASTVQMFYDAAKAAKIETVTNRIGFSWSESNFGGVSKGDYVCSSDECSRTWSLNVGAGLVATWSTHTVPAVQYSSNQTARPIIDVYLAVDGPNSTNYMGTSTCDSDTNYQFTSGYTTFEKVQSSEPSPLDGDSSGWATVGGEISGDWCRVVDYYPDDLCPVANYYCASYGPGGGGGCPPINMLFKWDVAGGFSFINFGGSP